MPPERVKRLRRWHLDAYREMRAGLPRRVFYLGLELLVPRGVFPPSGGGAFHRLVGDEVKGTDRVLDMGTGSGVAAILAARRSKRVLAVDINPRAVHAAVGNARHNGVGDRVTVRQSDVFDGVKGRFDLIVFDPPYRWFKARDLLELGTADENYGALTRFMAEVGDHLRPRGRVLLQFGTSGDIEYLRALIKKAGLRKRVVATEHVQADDLSIAYEVYRLTKASRRPPSPPRRVARG